MAGCDECHAELERLGVVVTSLSEAIPPVTPPSHIRETLLQRIDGTSGSKESPLRRHLNVASAAAPGLFVSRAAEGEWKPTDVPGVSLRVLFVDTPRNEFTALVRMTPGSAYPRHVHSGAEQCLVLEGDLHVEDDVFGPGDYQRSEVGSLHGIQRTERGCLLLITSSLTDEFV